jgi:hypothetical protein
MRRRGVMIGYITIAFVFFVFGVIAGFVLCLGTVERELERLRRERRNRR